MRIGLFCALLPALVASPAEAQVGDTRLVGRVFAAEGRHPIAGASVQLGGLTALTDARGMFALPNVPPGRQLLRLEALGYLPRADSINIVEGVTNEVTVQLAQHPIQLPSITVSVRSRWLELNGFYERRQSGLAGQYLTREEIDRRGATAMSDLFRSFSGLRVQRSVRGVNLVRMNHTASDALPILDQRARPPGCEPALFIDGTRYRDLLIVRPPDWTYVQSWDVLSPLAIEAIEVYVGSATPIEFLATCGVVLIWTRRN